MNKKGLIKLTSVAVIALAAGCNNEPVLDTFTDPDLIPVNISSSISQVHTKATAQGFVDKDAVGLFAVNYSEGNTKAGTLSASGNQADNVKYIFDEGKYKWNPVKSVYYKDVNTNVDLYLYYPYQNTINDVNAYGFEVQKDQSSPASASALSGYEASDLLWGKATEVTPVESAVSISLSHRLTAVNVSLVEGTGFSEDEFGSLSRSIILTNTTRKATFDFTTGAATALGQAQPDGIVMCPQEDGSFRAIVIPQSVSAGTQLFAITIDGVSYAFRQSSSTQYSAGKQVNFSIKINKKTIAGDYELELADVQISDWKEDRNTHGGEARQYYVVNVETPGTLGATIEAAGKNPSKIKNLKVTGTMNNQDFYYMRDEMSILEAVNIKEVKLDCDDEDKNIYHAPIIPNSAFHYKKTLTNFVFPDHVEMIDSWAFSGTNLSGSLVIPDGVTSIGYYAFESTNISSVSFAQTVEEIKQGAFADCKSLTGNLLLPEGLRIIEAYAFRYCSFRGRLSLPSTLEGIEAYAFWASGIFSGNLVIPEKVSRIEYGCFMGTTFNGSLFLSNVTEIEGNCFYNCGFHGDLVIPEGVRSISPEAFLQNSFSSVQFPSTLREIGRESFWNNSSLIGSLVIPEGVTIIGERAFTYARFQSVSLPSTLQTIQAGAFAACNYITSMSCAATEPPYALWGAFEGVSKSNFTLEVPTQSVKKYQSEQEWSSFTRISGDYGFSLDRQVFRLLNAGQSLTVVLHAPANRGWSIDADTIPDWLTVQPLNGTGKTDITITVDDMPRTDEAFYSIVGYYPEFPPMYEGRCCELEFQLDENQNSRTSFYVEQFDSDYSDGDVIQLSSASVGKGIDVVFTGDGYDACDIANGTFINNVSEGASHLFSIEPYKTYKEYFNVYGVVALSSDSGMMNLDNSVETKFGSHLTQERLQVANVDECLLWAKKANPQIDFSSSLVVLLINSPIYEGVTLMYDDGTAIACCPVSTKEYPYDFRGIIQHEAGGHGFGKLADEYYNHFDFYQFCNCFCCIHSPSDEEGLMGYYKSLGWYKNISISSDNKQVPWAHLIYNPQYSDYVDMYEGAYLHSRGIYRSEATSCMNNNIPYYSAISRQAIVERIMKCSGESFSLESFYQKDKDDMGVITKSPVVDRTYGVDPNWNLGSEHGSVVLMGQRPNVK